MPQGLCSGWVVFCLVCSCCGLERYLPEHTVPPNLSLTTPHMGAGSVASASGGDYASRLGTGWVQRGRKSLPSVQETLLGFIQRRGSARNKSEFSGQVSILPGEAEGKGAVYHSTPRAQHHPRTVLCPNLGRLSPAVEQRQEAGLLQGFSPGKLSFPSFTTKGKKAYAWF